MSKPVQSSATIVSFFAYAEAKAETVQGAIAANNRTVRVGDRQVKAAALRVDPAGARAHRLVEGAGQYLRDAKVSGAPPRNIARAWDELRLVGGSIGCTLGVGWGGEPGDVRNLEISIAGKPVGFLSILEGAQPKGRIVLARELEAMIKGEG